MAYGLIMATRPQTLREFKGGFSTAKGVTIPVGVSTFADRSLR